MKERCMVFIFLCGIVITLSISATTTPKLITKIPRYSGEMDYTQWSGYVHTNGPRNLYYVFVESKNISGPVILWLQGGPGCSGIMAYMTEHGPYNLNDDGSVVKNPYSLVGLGASVIYLDSPSGIGYGYDTNFDDFFGGGDNRTSDDLYIFLQVFFTTLFPKYRSNEFYLFGESYAGIYIPWLASRIDRENDMGINPKINLIGMMMSNAVMNFASYYNNSPIWMMAHSVISIEQYNNAKLACNDDFYGNRKKEDCLTSWNGIQDQQIGLNVLDLYSGCFSGIHNHQKRRQNDPMVDCINTKTSQDYFNQPEAYEDFGVVDEFHKYTGYWNMCSNIVQFGDNYITEYDNMIPWLQKLFQTGKYRMMIAAGDVDMTITPLQSQTDFNDIVNPLKTNDWNKWYTCQLPNNNQIAGWYRKVKGVTLATVLGAGHMISTYKPMSSWILYDRWLHNQFDNECCCKKK